MKKLQPMPAGEQATLLTGIEGEIAHVQFTVKENGNKGTARYNLIWHFDFANVAAEEILRLAVRSLRIDGQAAWRSAKDRMNADVWQDKTWSVRDMLDQTRQKASPEASAEKAINRLSKAERDALFAKYRYELMVEEQVKIREAGGVVKRVTKE